MSASRIDDKPVTSGKDAPSAAAAGTRGKLNPKFDIRAPVFTPKEGSAPKEAFKGKPYSRKYRPAEKPRVEQISVHNPADDEMLAKLPKIDYTYVNSVDKFTKMLDTWTKGGVKSIAVDMEFVPYNQKLSLIQIKDSLGKTYIIDVFRVPRSMLRDLMENDMEKVWFACATDVNVAKRDLGCEDINGVIDLHIYGTCLGVDCSLDKTEAIFLGHDVEDEGFKKKMQRSKWGHRPLREIQLVYAALDVEYLFELRDVIMKHIEGFPGGSIADYASEMNAQRCFQDSRRLFFSRVPARGSIQSELRRCMWIPLRRTFVEAKVLPPSPALLCDFLDILSSSEFQAFPFFPLFGDRSDELMPVFIDKFLPELRRNGFDELADVCDKSEH